jgi:hypothetical protein
MKKFYLTFTVVSAIGLLIFFGCSKESNKDSGKQENVFQPTEKDLQIESKILEFESKIDFARKNPDLKSGGDDLTLDKAIWYIEALANYNYADASSGFDNYIGETAEIEVPLTDGKVSISDAVIAYDQVIDSLSEHFSHVSGTDKHLVLADNNLKEVNGATATFNVTSGVGDGPPNPFAGFGESDYWWWANLSGKCDGSGQGVGSDAAEQIQSKVNRRIALPSGHKYFIDIKIVSCDPTSDEIKYDNTTTCTCCSLINPDDPIPGNNINDMLLFLNYGYPVAYPNFHTCIPPDEMNFYLGGLEDIVYDIAYDCFPLELEDKLFVSCDMVGDMLYGGGPEYWVYHKVDIRYGISVGSGNPPPDEL